MRRQLSFDLPVRLAMGREDFFVSPANAAAVAMIEGWLGWAGRKLMLTGPAGSGKTHLASVWCALSGARMIPAADLARADIPALAAHHVAVEDVQEIAGDEAGEAALFHLHNLALAEGRSLLLTADRPPHLWRLGLADLASRMEGTTRITLDEPDDALLAAVLMKLFSDRQLSPAPDTIPYLTRRIPRAFAAAHRIVAALDEAALASGRPISRTLARDLLDKSGP